MAASAQAAPSDVRNRRPDSNSRINTFFLCATVMGIGVVGGFCTFYAVWRDRCTEIRQYTSSDCQAQLVQVREQYAAKLQKQQKELAKKDRLLLSNEKTLQDQVQDCLNTQSDTAYKHQELMQQYENIKAIINERQHVIDDQHRSIENLNEQVKRLKRELGQATIQAQSIKLQHEQQREVLTNQLSAARSTIASLREANGSSNSNSGDNNNNIVSTTASNVDRTLSDLRASVQRRALMQTLQTHGHGPYCVRFTIEQSSTSTGDAEAKLQSYFQVELVTVNEMPHTIGTFLNLVRQGLYKGTTLSITRRSSNNNNNNNNNEDDNTNNNSAAYTIVIGGSPDRAALVHRRGELRDQYTKQGYGSMPFMFSEIGPNSVCEAYSWRIVGHGPAFEIIVPTDEDNSVALDARTCPGKVTSGRQTLDDLVRIWKDNANMDHAAIIVDVAVLSDSDCADDEAINDEL